MPLQLLRIPSSLILGERLCEVLKQPKHRPEVPNTSESAIMSLGSHTLRPCPEGSNVVSTEHNGHMGVPDVMLHGFQTVRNTLGQVHPLEYSEANWQANQEKMDMSMLRNVQGLHAPLRLQMERKTAMRFGRLPGMTSSNLMADQLSGRLDTIDFDDFLGNPTEAEAMGDTHALIEKKLNLI